LQICLTLLERKDGDVEDPFLKIFIETLGIGLTARDLDTSFGAYLGGIYVQYLQLKGFNDQS
jgi:hypothetical protein